MEFRHSAGFGKRIEFFIIARMIEEELDVYVPVVDFIGIDAVVRVSEGSFAEVQIKARSKNVKRGTEALFSVQKHNKARKDYWFVFCSEALGKMWIMSSEEFMRESSETKSGKWKGRLRYINFNAKRKNTSERYLAPDFSRISKFRPALDVVREEQP